MRQSLYRPPATRRHYFNHPYHTLLRSAARCVLLLGGLIWAASQAAYADTTWVAGAVSGTWTVEGSPYVILDTATVLPSTTLTVLPGVEVLLPDSDSRFLIGGATSFLGAVHDSVIIKLQDEQSAISVFQATRVPSVRFSNTAMYGSGTIWIKANSISVARCTVAADLSAVNYALTIDADSAAIVESVIMRPVRVWSSYSVVHRVELGDLLDLTWGDWVIDSVAETGRPAQSTLTVVLGPGDTGRLASSNISVVAIQSYGSGPVRIDSCRVTGDLYADGVSELTVTGCQVVNFVTYGSEGSINRCVLGDGGLHSESSLEIQNCTFYSGLRGSIDPHYFFQNLSSNINLRNCIFYARSPLTSICPDHGSPFATPPRYNLSFGMINPWRGRFLGPGNFIAEPWLDLNCPMLAPLHDSPAIDAGDPQFRDPDGTVSDIGATWWDHRVDHPPVITTSRQYEVGWGDWVRLELSASDEGTVIIEPTILFPPWLHADRRLDDVSRLIYHGRVPHGAQSFQFDLVASDQQFQRDQETISVRILPRSTISDTVSGVLTAEFSPYCLSDEVVVPAGDTLIIEHGVTIQVEASEHWPWIIVLGTLLALGTEDDSITISGNRPDAWGGIHVLGAMASADLSYVTFGGVGPALSLDSASYCHISNCRFESEAPYGGQATSFDVRRLNDTLRISSCTFQAGNGPVIVQTPYRADRCEFESNVSAYVSTGSITNSIFRSCGIAVWLGGSANVTGNLFRAAQASISILAESESWYGGLQLLVHNNTFVGDPTSQFDFRLYDDRLCQVEVINNIVTGATDAAFSFTGNCDSTRVNISHNCFWGNAALFTDEFEPAWQFIGPDVGVNINGDSVDAYFNLVTDPSLSDSLGHLTAESPCIDAGIDIGLPFIGAAPDIGYLEFTPEGRPERLLATDSVEVCRVAAIAYPNPSTGTANLCFEGDWHEQIQVKMYNILGQCICQRTIARLGRNTVSMDLNDGTLASGQYFLVVADDVNRSTLKFNIVY